MFNLRKRGYMDFYILSRIFWSFIIGFILGAILTFLVVKGIIPISIPFLK